MANLHKITPFLWFDGNAEEAIAHYLTIFQEGRIHEITRNTDAGPGPVGEALVVSFELAGQPFLALNGGPGHPFTEAVSFSVDCVDQTEVDYYWDALSSDGGTTNVCGWLKDKYGLCWQVVPRRLPELLADRDAAKAARVMKAMMAMAKIDVAQLEAAAAAA